MTKKGLFADRIKKCFENQIFDSEEMAKKHQCIQKEAQSTHKKSKIMAITQGQGVFGK
jgi:hypothetical protein